MLVAGVTVVSLIHRKCFEIHKSV